MKTTNELANAYDAGFAKAEQKCAQQNKELIEALKEIAQISDRGPISFIEMRRLANSALNKQSNGTVH